jgi:hypothetical protein
MYSDIKSEFLQSSRKFADSITKSELDSLMSEFDDYEIESSVNWFETQESLIDYYRKYKLFESFSPQTRRSVNLGQDILRKSPKRVLSSL